MYVIVDSNFICHAIKYKIGDLSYNEKKVGIVFGFLRQILSLAKRYDKPNFIFCWDSRKSLRKEIYPLYKEKTFYDRTPEEIELDKLYFQQFNEIQNEVLPELGFKNIFCAEGYESDDIIVQTARNLSYDEKNGQIVIVSSDHDLYQVLFEDTIVIFNPTTKKHFREADLLSELNCTPEMWPYVKAMAGCSSDHIAGLPNIGEKTAIKFLRKTLPQTTVAYKVISSEDGKQIVERNKLLVTLPFEGTPTFRIKKDEKLTINNLLTVCNRYGFLSLTTASALQEWEQYVFFN